MKMRAGCVVGAMALLASTTACIKPPALAAPPIEPEALRSRVLAADGSELAVLFTENRVPLDLDDVPQHVVDAVIVAEDQRFFSHKGFDAKAIARAALANQRSGRAVQGGSTITQQYVKNVYYGGDRPKTFEQKVKEAQLAWQLESRMGKREILEKYLNTVYFGDGAYGIQAAAETYFRKDVSELTIAEGALLAAVIRAPESYNPRRDHDRAIQRRNYVLGRMKNLRKIDAKQMKTEKASAIGLVDPPATATKEPYFIDYLKRVVAEDPAFGETEEARAEFLYRSGATIRTTIDPRLQDIGRRSIDEILNRPGDPEAALVAIEPKTGRVVAMIGGRDYSKSQVNLATGLKGGGTGRQPGSAFKPFVLAAAIEDGMTPYTVYPSSNPILKSCRPTWRPRNIEGAGGGPITLENAMIHSVNAVYARLGVDVGPSRVARTAERMGVSFSKLESVCPIALGSEEVSPLEMAAAYATFANQGVATAPKVIDEIDRPGEGAGKHPAKQTRAIDPGTAYLVTDVLTKVVSTGTATRAQIGRPAAGKTGTSQDNADAWFVGYTPDLVTAVWVGYPHGRVPMRNVHGTRVFGGGFPAMIWKRFMERALSGKPPLAFELPAGDMVTIDIDPATGLLAGPYCAGRQTITILRQLAPRSTCPSPPPAPVHVPPPTSTATSTATPGPSPGSSPGPSTAPSAPPSPSPSPSPSPGPSP